MRSRTIYSISAVILAISAITLAAPLPAKPEAPRAIITWQAQTTAPPEYRGKLQLNRTSALTASLLITQNGSVVDLREKEIRWFRNNELVSRGLGLTTLTVPAERPSRSQIELRALVKNFSGFDVLFLFDCLKDVIYFSAYIVHKPNIEE